MKCIHCQVDVLYKEREDGKCPQCKHAFAFEPKKGDKFTDGAFKAAIERVSSKGTVKWTPEHLYYDLVKRSAKSGKAALGLAFIALLLTLLGFTAPPVFFPAAVFWIIAFAQIPWPVARLTPQDFQPLWDRWLSVHGEPEALIVRKVLPAASPPRALPSDIDAYSFDRAVVTDRSETVDLLLANNFHFENNCAILSIDGYPQAVFETVRVMLKRNPKLVVYALHDASMGGCLLAHRLARSPEWFAGSARVVDVGLNPRQAKPFKGSFQRPARGADPSPLLSSADNAWLARYSLSLAAIPPEQLIKRLFRAMTVGTSAALPTTGDDGVGGEVFYLHDGSLSTEASASDGGGDSFG
ncbi:MAG: hypothetical protein ABI193_19005 [Minicystis sp.]